MHYVTISLNQLFQLDVMILYQKQCIKSVNYSGIIDLPNMPTKVGVNGQHDNLFIPPEAENNNEVVTNQPVTQVNYTGSGSKGHQATDKETAHEVITTEKAGLAKLVHNNPMVLAIAGIGIMALGS